MVIVDNRETTLLKVGLVQLIILALLAFSLIKHHHYLSLLLMVLLVFIYGARLWGRFSLHQLTVCLSFDQERIFPGEEVQLTLRSENRKLLPIWIRVVIPVPGELHDESGKTSLHREQGLLWYQSMQSNWRLVPEQRGIYRLGPPQVIVGDLMGLYPREMVRSQDPLYLIVYPRLVPLRSFDHIRRDLFGSPGSKSPVEDPIYLLGTRDYQAGSPSRYIHWRSSARLNRLQERIFEPSRQARVLFILDVTPFAAAKAGDLFEKALEGLASLAVECDRRGFAVGLVTNGANSDHHSPVISTARSRSQSTLILETLAGVTMTAGQTIGENLQRVKGLGNGVSCVLFALHGQEASAGPMAILHQRNITLTTVYCGDPDNSAAMGPGAWMVPLDSLLLKEARSV